jgi:hypothetical protein
MAHRLEELERQMGGATGAGRGAIEFARPAAGEVVEPFEASMKTLPSGGALATEAAAISPLAPPRFSTTTERFSRSAMPGATMRANRSLGPPGGNPTMKRRGRSGKSAAWARAAKRGRPASGSEESPAIAERRRSRDIGAYARLPGFWEETK